MMFEKDSERMQFASKFVHDEYKTREVCVRAVLEWLFILQSIPDQYSTQTVCERCSFVLKFLPAQYKAQEISEKTNLEDLWVLRILIMMLMVRMSIGEKATKNARHERNKHKMICSLQRGTLLDTRFGLCQTMRIKETKKVAEKINKMFIHLCKYQISVLSYLMCLL